jgi:hypothetical protein
MPAHGVHPHRQVYSIVSGTAQWLCLRRTSEKGCPEARMPCLLKLKGSCDADVDARGGALQAWGGAEVGELPADKTNVLVSFYSKFCVNVRMVSKNKPFLDPMGRLNRCTEWRLL